jgi:hypothetical protein
MAHGLNKIESEVIIMVRTMMNESVIISSDKDWGIAEYVDRRFNEMLAQFPPSEQINTKMRPGDLFYGVHNSTAQRWPHLDSLRHDKIGMSPAQVRDEYDLIKRNKDTKGEKLFDQAYAKIKFGSRVHKCHYGKIGIRHSIVSMTHIGDVPYCFESPEDELLDAMVLMGVGRHSKRGFLFVNPPDGRKRVFELEEFCMLSITYKDEASEMGTFTLFNKKLDVLYVDVCEGRPELRATTYDPIDVILGID